MPEQKYAALSDAELARFEELRGEKGHKRLLSKAEHRELEGIKERIRELSRPEQKHTPFI
jgi:hypothetical protein